MHQNYSYIIYRNYPLITSISFFLLIIPYVFLKKKADLWGIFVLWQPNASAAWAQQ